MGITCFLYLCLFCYSITFSILYHTYAAFMLAILLGTLPVFVALIGWIQHFFVCVKVNEVMGIVEKDSFVQINFEIENRGILPISELRIPFYYRMPGQKKKKGSIRISISGRHTEHTIFQIPTEYCGMLCVSFRKFRCFDLWHLFSFGQYFNTERKKIWRMHPPKKFQFLILPQFEEIELDSNITNISVSYEEETTEYSKTKKGDDPSEIFDIREYHPGDDIKRIHWKLSSKKEMLMVKDFSLPLNCNLWILFDHFIKPDEKSMMECFDQQMEQFASLSYSLLLNELVHVVAWYSTFSSELICRQIKSEDDFYEMLSEILNENPGHSSNAPYAFHEKHNCSGVDRLFYFGNEPEILTSYGYRIIETGVEYHD